MQGSGIYNYRRRPTRGVKVGRVVVGGGAPIALQSMTNTVTTDISGSVAQIRAIADAGGDIVRLTTQGIPEATALGPIGEELRRQGYAVPLVADVHFNPAAAFTAAESADKVRINPGNFVNPGKELRPVLVPFLQLCREKGRSIRIGVNHGSLSPKMTELYGDTPEGMVASVEEFLDVCEEEDFRDVVISIKASNPVVMTETVRLLAQRLDAKGRDYPLHLGVTEAGDGEDGRVKSAVGIGCLLAEGLGDTIRVSLSEPPENEIPVARRLRDYISARSGHEAIAEPSARHRRESLLQPGWEVFPAQGVDFENLPEGWVEISPRHANPVGAAAAEYDRLRSAGDKRPAVLRLRYDDGELEAVQVKAGADFGALLLNGYGEGIWLDAPNLTAEERRALSLGILQACRLRMTKTEYIACPSCGRTLFDLQTTLKEVKEATSHLKGLKLGVMGCIVNGPGEMADADYGFVGAGPGRVSLYRGREVVERNIPREEALPKFIEMIKRDGRWREPE